jgi:hypothetical protein
VGELSVLIKRRHPDVRARIDLVYQEALSTRPRSASTARLFTQPAAEAKQQQFEQFAAGRQGDDRI